MGTSNEQLAHDLAVAKLCGSKLSNQELIETYRKYYNEILDILMNEPKETNKAKILNASSIF